MSFLNFAEVKASHPIDGVVERLGLATMRHGDQLRSPCPKCQRGGDRALVVTLSKGAFYCFPSETGGDVISLVAHVQGIGMKEAAQWIAGAGSPERGASSGHIPNERKGNEERRLLKPLNYLEPAHDGLKGLGIAPETLEHFGAGYAPKGIMRGRLAIPIHDPDGQLVAYCGHAVGEDQEPKLIFPNGFNPALYLFNGQRIGEGELILTRSVLSPMKAFEAGIENVIAVLTETVSADQLNLIADLMRARQCDCIDLQ
ncbi:MAG: CHC2 zinc finger domain-containing protein [Kiloniellales bacterium]